MQSQIGVACPQVARSFGPYSIRWRFIIFITLAVIVGLCVTLVWTTNHIRQEAELVAIEKVKADLTLAESLLDSRFPGPWANRDGKLYKGTTLIDENFLFVDEIGNKTGDTCSIFLGDMRVATNVMRDNRRAVDTKVSPEVAQIVLTTGQTFLGEANVVGIKYQTAYKPLYNAAGQIIGIWYVGANKTFVDTMLDNTVKQVTLAFLIGWLIIILAVWTLTSSLIKPVNSLIRAANRVASGDLETAITPSSRDEIGYLAQTFEQMREKLRLNNQNLETLVNERTAELKQAYADLKQLDELKSSFLSTVSHELRTPLTSVLGFAKIIQKKLEDVIFPQVTDQSPKVTKAMQQTRNNIDIIVTEGERLTDLINDVLDLAKMESGKIEWKTEQISLKEIIARAVNTSEALWVRKELTVFTDVAANLPAVPGDRDRILQVILNLLSNAVKFTIQGSITCRAVQQDNELLISVSDTGIGIAPEAQSTVFEKFKQIGDTLTEKPQGTGLGLPICKQIIEHHGGSIWVESTLGKGSTFFFTLPLSPQAESSPRTLDVEPLLHQIKYHVPEPNKHPGQPKTILIVDDDSNIRSLLRQELESVGYKILEAADGIQALDRVYDSLKEPEHAVIPDLIILDVMMPKMNGFDVAAALKTNPATLHIPIVILSVVEDQRRGWLIGVNRYLTKPVNMDTLLKEVATLLTLDKNKKNILVADQDQEIIYNLTSALTASGYRVCTAADGQECLRKAKAEMPGVIILDSVLSEQFDIIKALRDEQGLENVVLFLLAKSPPRQ